MRGFLAVFEREIVERRLLLAAALVLGLVPLLAPLLPGMPSGPPAELRGGTALGIALVLTLALALLLGSSVIARDLVERRLGFYFARPLSGAALWAGKLAAATALTVGAGLLVLLPTTLLNGFPDASGYWGTSSGVFRSGFDLAVIWFGILLLTISAAHAMSVMIRSRSPWLLLDLVALGITVPVAGTCLLTLARNGAGVQVWERFGPAPVTGPTLLLYIEIAVALVALLGLTLAGGAQVTRGRTDLRRGHRVLSIVLWSLLLPAALGLAGYTRWFLAASPEDLVSVHGTVGSPASPWIAIYGQAAHRGGYRPGFLYDVGSGRFVRAGFGRSSFSSGLSPFNRLPLARFSADGRRAVWLESGDMRTPRDDQELMTLDLRRPGASPQPTRVLLRGMVSSFALSPDGRRVAAIHDSRLTVDEIDSGRLLASARLEGVYYGQQLLAFSGPDRVRLYQLDLSYELPSRTGMTLSLSELDVATGRLTTTRVEDAAYDLSAGIVGLSGDRILLRGRNVLQLRDGATGKLVAELGKAGVRGSFLPEGKVALLTRETAGSDLRILDAGTGTELRRFHFPAVRTVVVADQPGPEIVRVVTRGAGGSAPWQLWMLDLSTGEARPGQRLALTTLPFLGAGAWPSSRGRDGMVWFDPASAREVVVLRDGLPGR
ncbi:MAG: hypothetical protein QOF89_4517 [Acidobacteriota bacterium]|jgi:hypothetical protein|nr:hypothetical protein [Acidobacteriota bacterium]